MLGQFALRRAALTMIRPAATCLQPRIPLIRPTRLLQSPSSITTATTLHESTCIAHVSAPFRSFSFKGTSPLFSRHQQPQQQQQQQQQLPPKQEIPQAEVAPPTLVFELPNPPNVRLFTGLTAAQSVFWAYVYYLGLVNDNVPLWWGAVGIATSLTFAAALNARARRTVTEVAMYQGGHTVRLQIANLIGQKSYIDVPLASIGPNPNPTLTSKNTARYWTLKIAQRNGYFLLDRDGEIYDLWNFNRILGYDVYSSVKKEDQHLIKVRAYDDMPEEADPSQSQQSPPTPSPQQQQPPIKRDDGRPKRR